MDSQGMISTLKARLRTLKQRFARCDNQRSEQGQREAAAIRQLEAEIKKLEKDVTNA